MSKQKKPIVKKLMPILSLDESRVLTMAEKLILSELRAIRQLLEKGIPVYEVFENEKH